MNGFFLQKNYGQRKLLTPLLEAPVLAPLPRVLQIKVPAPLGLAPLKAPHLLVQLTMLPKSISTLTTVKKALAMRTYFQQKNYGPAPISLLLVKAVVAPLPEPVLISNKSLLPQQQQA